jgi:uncharacterized protein GlcG (DUF336 family)
MIEIATGSDVTLPPENTNNNPTPNPLVTRTVYLHLAGAETIIAGAKAKAKELKVPVSIAVIDASEVPLALVRMDGARDGSFGAAFFGVFRVQTSPTGPGFDKNKDPDAVSSASITVSDQVIGTVRCAGATPKQTAEIARAGIQALHDALKKAK